jgi:hypothetical protein
MRRAVAAVAAALAVAGCAGGGLFDERIAFVDHDPAYSPLEFGGFAAAGPLVEARGPIPGGASAEELAAALRLPGFFPQTPFRVAPPAPSEARQARIVLAFGPGAGFDPVALCRGGVDGAGGGEGLGVAAAWCRGGSPLGWGRLDHRRPLAPGDPAFTASMRRLFGEIAPPRRPNDPREDRCVIFC